MPAWLAALAAFVLLACGLTWPLPRYFQTHLLGETSGDVGVYVWNLWIFRHELVEHGHLPVSTDHLFTYTDGLDFALHNYTPLAGLLGVPLMDWLGIVGTFNVILIASMALSGLGVFLLARRIGLSERYAWTAGALFIASPVLTARASEHFSLITAAPLPLFMWALLRALDRKRRRDAILVGTLVAVATYSDVHYGIYCAIAGAFLVLWTYVRVRNGEGFHPRPSIERAVNVCIAAVALLIAWRIFTGSTSIALGAIRIGLQTLYTPVFVLTLLAVARAWLTWRPRFDVHDPDGAIAHARAARRPRGRDMHRAAGAAYRRYRLTLPGRSPAGYGAALAEQRPWRGRARVPRAQSNAPVVRQHHALLVLGQRCVP